MKSRKMAEKIRLLDENLLEWHSTRNKRSFPWRGNKDPYQVLIAEIMLQRTKADQVVPVYTEFIREFPTISKLDAAPLIQVKRYFARLGLMWRATRMKKMAKEVTKRFNGKIPRDRNELVSLSGIGEYIADAVLSFAFGQDVSVVDCNVCRVVERVFGLEHQKEARRNRIFKAISTELLPPRKAKEFNWAIIDLASLVCLPGRPLCFECPLAGICLFAEKVKSR